MKHVSGKLLLQAFIAQHRDVNASFCGLATYKISVKTTSPATKTTGSHRRVPVHSACNSPHPGGHDCVPHGYLQHCKFLLAIFMTRILQEGIVAKPSTVYAAE
uniref:SWIM-type domain-containing protein n=1 Tax=Syphacia muris TaxID=451379 RepID=A0A0N5ACZ5_9BILA